MKLLTGLLLFMGMAVVSEAQQPAAIQGPPDVSVLKFDWSRERLPGWENNPFGPSFETYDTMRARVEDERRLKQARNSGNKAEAEKIERDLKVREKTAAPKIQSEKTERPRDGYRYKVWLRNDSLKTIKSIDWDYVFLDPSNHSEIARHQFTSDEKIRPGKDRELNVFILSPPIRTIKADELNKKRQSLFNEQVIIMRVEYSDGSVWQRP